jgi:MarR family transcriptional regulator for hemolysin
LLAKCDHYKSKRFIPRIAFRCKLPFVAEGDEQLRVEEPVAERAPRSVGFLISQLGFFSSKRFMEALAPVGIDPREFMLLRFVAASEGRSQQALAERIAIPPSRMVALVDRLEEAGLVERARDPEDRRAWRLHVTEKAQPLIEKLQGVGAELVKQAFAGIDRKDIETARKVLAQARENAGRAGVSKRASNQ